MHRSPSFGSSAPLGSVKQPIRLGRRALLVLAAALFVATLWAGAATWYLVFHDEVLARFVSQQSAMQYGYEERIGALRLQLDRAAMENHATRDGIATRLAELAQHQSSLEKRQAALSGLAGDAVRPLPEPAPIEEAPLAEATAVETLSRRPGSASKPFPTPDALELRRRDEDGSIEPGRQSLRDAATTLSRLEQRLDGLAAAQMRVLDGIGIRAIRDAQRLRSLVARIGLDPKRFERERDRNSGLGGPLVPIAADPFGIAMAQAQRSIGEEDRLRRITQALPLRRPIVGDYSLSSGFGPRLDPFTRGLALHTGLDMKAELGSPARATAAGRVTSAEHAGGYGNLVEIDHGNGLSTRYAHLSAYAVVPGQWVGAGAIVGRVGSTGRSTGSHLHYETRIDGEPVDPQRFLRVGATLEGDDPRPYARLARNPE